jgi:hypothetical protein
MHVMFDTQTAVIDLKAAGFEDRQAVTIVTVIKNSQCELATKQDIKDLQQNIKLLELRLVIKLGAVIFASFGLFAGLMAYIIKVGV